jgi:hypothetical protein
MAPPQMQTRLIIPKHDGKDVGLCCPDGSSAVYGEALIRGQIKRASLEESPAEKPTRRQVERLARNGC